MTGPRLIAATLAAVLAAVAWFGELVRLPSIPAPDTLPGQLTAQKAVTRASLIQSTASSFSKFPGPHAPMGAQRRAVGS